MKIKTKEDLKIRGDFTLTHVDEAINIDMNNGLQFIEELENKYAKEFGTTKEETAVEVNFLLKTLQKEIIIKFKEVKDENTN